MRVAREGLIIRQVVIRTLRKGEIGTALTRPSVFD